MAAAGAAYPAALTFDAPLKVARWRPLFAWLVAIPHLVVAYALNVVGEVMAVIGWFAIMFTGKLPEGTSGVQCMCLRYATRATAYAGFLLEPYPPFSFETTGADPGDLAGLRIDYTPQLTDRNRVTVFFRILMVIPHLVVITVLGIVASLAYVVGFFAVLIMGAWPDGLRSFILKVLGYSIRLQAYMYLLTDEYPAFALG